MIEDKQNKQLGIKSVTVVFNDDLSQEGKDILYTLTNQEKNIDYKRLGFKRDKNLEFGFRDFKVFKRMIQRHSF